MRPAPRTWREKGQGRGGGREGEGGREREREGEGGEEEREMERERERGRGRGREGEYSDQFLWQHRIPVDCSSQREHEERQQLLRKCKEEWTATASSSRNASKL